MIKLFTTLLLATVLQSADISKSLQKTWVLKYTEEFGTKDAVKDSLLNDFMDLKADGTFKMKFYGKEKSGTYKYNAANKFLNFSSGNEKFYFKFFELNGTNLLMEYQHPSLIRTKLYFEELAK